MQKWLVVFFLSIAATQTLAAIGSISESTSPAKLERGKNKLVAEKGTGVEMQDAVETTLGKVSITFRDDTKVEVNDHSRLEIDEFVFDPSAPTASKLAVNFAKGTVRYASGAIAHNDPSKVDIQTPVATVAVRGTDFTATVDESGASTFILLPSCPRVVVDIDRDCKTGVIDVFNDAGRVTLNRPFHATKVFTRNQAPTKPVVLNLSADTIDNLIIVAPPVQIQAAVDQVKASKERSGVHSGLNTGFVDGNILDNIFMLASSIIDQHQTSAVITTQTNTLSPGQLANSVGSTPASKHVKIPSCLADGSSNIQCVTVPTTQSTTISQTQGNTSVINKVSNGGNTVITLRQN